MNKYSFLLLLVVLPFISTGQVTGKIIDQENDYPLEYATAALFNQESKELVTGVITDMDGVFTIENVKNGTYYLEASFIGFETKTIANIKVQNRKPVDVGSIPLKIGGTMLEEVVVQGERATVINKIDRQIFDANKFQNSLGGNATDIIKNIPSVTVDAQGEISVRGSSGFVVLLNGNPVQGNASDLLNQFPANAVERVEVITAPSAKYDPEGKAGLINIITKKGATDGSFAQINVKGGFPSIETYGNDEYHQRYGADATYNIRKEDWNISLGASFQRNDLGGRREGDVFTIINDTLTQFPSTGERSFDETNYSGRFTVDYTPDTLNTFSLGFYAGKRQKDRLADIVYYDNHAITPASGGDRLYTFQYYNHNLRTRKSDFALGSSITPIPLKITLVFPLPFYMNTRFWADLPKVTTLGSPTETSSINKNTTPMTTP